MLYSHNSGIINDLLQASSFTSLYLFRILFKRICDICFAALLIILTAPLFLCIALLIKLDSPGAVFYKQERMGLHNKIFTIWKFRTMVVDADERHKELEQLNEMKDGVLFKLKDDPRITRVGKFLRSSSLDELPQLFNVLLGDMSLVGPRPFALRDIEKISKRHYIRHAVLPGITGFWQVSGRSNITDFEQVVRLDTYYIENWSILLDLKILLKTIVVVLKKTGAY
ncbi:MAG TPA: exopolysaccharide biosynthesis polyprenyl glycosylphosphotransferase [Oculatellaceae cyanobacterium]|jgi:exopolysaccharide biosynthesis polyprenyl glycosylphosphotransferase